MNLSVDYSGIHYLSTLIFWHHLLLSFVGFSKTGKLIRNQTGWKHLCQLISSLTSLTVRSFEKCCPGSEGVSLGAAPFTCTSPYLSLIKALLRRTTCPLWTEAWPPNKSMLFSCVDMRRRKQMWRNEVEVAILVPGCRSASLKLQPTLSRSHKLFWGFKSASPFPLWIETCCVRFSDIYVFFIFTKCIHKLRLHVPMESKGSLKFHLGLLPAN